MIACAIGCSAPPPAPCNTRIASSIGRDVETPHRNDESVKIPTQNMRNLFRPNFCPNHDVNGMTIAFEIR